MNLALLAQDSGSGVRSAVVGGWGTVVTSCQQAFGDIVSQAPHVIGAIIVLVIGFIISRVLGRIATAVCERIGLQTGAERSGLAESMKQVGINRPAAAIVGTIIFWLSMCVFLMAAFDVLGLASVSAAIQPIVEYIPRILVAAAMVVVGLLLANFLRGVIATSADRVGIAFAEHLARGVYYVLVLMIGVEALKHLNVELELLNTLILIAFGGLAVGFALAFGLGGRDVMGGILAGYYLRQRIQAGDHVSVAGMEGTVRDVGPVATIIETEEDGLVHRHSIPNGKMLSEAVR